jgi:hypothetical protein
MLYRLLFDLNDKLLCFLSLKVPEDVMCCPACKEVMLASWDLGGLADDIYIVYISQFDVYKICFTCIVILFVCLN